MVFRLNCLKFFGKVLLGLESFYDVLTSLEKLGQVVDKELENQHGDKPNFINDTIASVGGGHKKKQAVFIGRLWPEKGCHILIQAWVEANKILPYDICNFQITN